MIRHNLALHCACLVCGCLLPATCGAQGNAPLVLTATLDDEAISPGSVRYLERALQMAGEQQAECLVIILDTPGGLLTSTRSLVKKILGSRTPVVVYVSPQGSRAASAGVFVTISAHVAAMTPGTTIGAAHPVQVGGGLPGGPRSPRPVPAEQGEDAKAPGDQESPSSPMQQKLLNDTVSWARALAEQRGRNADWVAKAVKQSASITAEQAADQNVVDIVADDLDQLLEKMDGRQVDLAQATRTLHTAEAQVRALPMWWGERVLTLIAQPNVAFLLMMFGFYGILFEFYSPGWGVSGTFGTICILLGLFGLSVLPVNYLGLALLMTSIALLTAEVFVTSYGALAVAGTICMVFGGSMLVDSPSGFARVSLSVLLPLAGATAVITLVLVSGIVRSLRSPVQTGGEGLIGDEAVADETFAQDDGVFRGAVRIHGERWRAVSEQPLQSGETCQVSGRDGLLLFVNASQE